MVFRFLIVLCVLIIYLNNSFSLSIPSSTRRERFIQQKGQENEARKKSIQHHVSKIEKSKDDIKKIDRDYDIWFDHYGESMKAVNYGHSNREPWLKLQEQRNKLKLQVAKEAKPLKLTALFHTSAPPTIRQILSDRAEIIHSSHQRIQREMQFLKETGKHDSSLVEHHRQQNMNFVKTRFIDPKDKHKSDIAFHNSAINSHQQAIRKNEGDMSRQSHCKIM